MNNENMKTENTSGMAEPPITSVSAVMQSLEMLFLDDRMKLMVCAYVIAKLVDDKLGSNSEKHGATIGILFAQAESFLCELYEKEIAQKAKNICAPNNGKTH